MVSVLSDLESVENVRIYKSGIIGSTELSLQDDRLSWHLGKIDLIEISVIALGEDSVRD